MQGLNPVPHAHEPRAQPSSTGDLFVFVTCRGLQARRETVLAEHVAMWRLEKPWQKP